ncbi:MAG: ATPase [Clostridia bacterium]|nr:ATPase [Clostridia bacterium]
MLEILRVLDELEKMIEESTRIPMTGKVVLESENVLDFIDKIRSLLPEEIRQAQWVAKERERLIKEAENEAKRIISDARNEIKKLADETEIVKEADARAKSIYEEAKKEANEVINGANEYAAEVLRNLEGTLTRALNVIRKGIDQLDENKQ